MRSHPESSPPPLAALALAALGVLAGAARGRQEAAPEPAFEARLERFLAAADAAPERTALLVGIDRYPDVSGRGFPDLGGCTNDVERFGRLLVERFGFEERNVFRLLNEEATHANIVRAFERVLIRRSGADTEAVFYYSGHGSRTLDLGGSRAAEPTGTDATFVAHDSRLGADGEHDLADDELRSLLAALTARTGHVLVVTDSCHSGDVLRGEGRTRSVRDGHEPLDLEWVRRFWPADVPLVEDADEVQLPPDRYLHVAAAAPEEQAWELELEDEDGRESVQGTLTYFLVQALEAADPALTWRALIDDVAVRVASVRPQTVTTRGDSDRRVFGGAFERVAGYKAQAMPGGSLRVDAGWLQWIRPGSVLEIRDGRGAERLGTAEVVAATASVSRARWVDDPPDELPAGALRAIERSRSPEEPPLRVRVEDPELRPLLAGCELAELVEQGAADYRLRRGAEGEVRLETREGLTLFAEPLAQDDDAVRRLEDSLWSELRWRSLVLLATERGTYPLEVGFRQAGEEELAGLAQYAPVEVLADGTAGPDETGSAGARSARVRGVHEPTEAELERFARGELGPPRRLGVLEIRNPYDRDLYVYVLSVEESRARNPIAPLRGADPELLPAGATTRVLFGVRAMREWPLERPMRDRYLVLATTKPCELSLFAAPAVMRGAEEAPAPPLLELAFDGRLTRGARATVQPGGWGVSSFDLWVESP